ncbi:hypothetical protein Cob_v003091 [Colletotrichum orbiculare MAFF 240422]|uniref:Uncharacterized protein n=1 Tax=Colletotrichum orbiculare (strain 104-T / ATCC 96160 / CBS 514.97 / LARS 414 / MAFF 240422) TaxID=1213857 RepID=N4VVZ5_COLOR|nr:hypothetical protein Cob_v003091 [Colletotrichum orbiculare MAFF 240422]
MSRSLVGRALRAKASVWEQPAGCIAQQQQQQQQQRSFSQTPHQNNQVIFDKTSTPALAPILEEIQSKIILPFHLPVHQRKRVFSEKLKNTLRTDPVYVEVDGYEHKFDHINRDSLPASRTITWKALRAMETAEDWNNFGRLLAGMHHAGRRFTDVDAVKMIRLAGVKGQVYTIIEAARQVRKTGFRLDTSEKVNETLHSVQMRAAGAAWDQDKTEQALRWTEMVLAMLEDKAHQPKHRDVPSDEQLRFPLHKDPQVVAAALHISAVLAVKHNDGKDVGGKVAKYAAQVLKRWPAGAGLKNLHPEGAYKNRESGVAYLVESRTQYLAAASPILHGLLLAARVVDKQTAQRLKAISDALGLEVNQEVENDQGPAARGLATYQTLFQ